MKEELKITTERIDDFVVLLALMQHMELPAILDRQLPRHWLQQGLSWGWTATIWLAHIVSQGDHRKLTVRDWVRQAHSTLEQVTGLEIRETDFTDDRLTIVLRHLAQEQRWQGIEQELGEHLVRVYALEEQPIRVDATTVSGYREGGKDSLWQFGHSKDDPTLRQIKAMMATVDPLALPLALEGVSGERVLVVRSQAYADTQQRHLEERLAKAQEGLLALTPPVGRGKRQISEEVALVSAAQAILSRHRVTGLLTYRFERQVEQEVKLVGRGRGGAKRPQQVIEQVRYQITAVERQEEALATLVSTLGWRAYA